MSHLVSLFKSYIIGLRVQCLNVVNTTKDYMKRLHFNVAFLQWDRKPTKSSGIVS